MDDGFNFGTPAGRVSRAGGNPTVWFATVGVLVVALLVWAGLSFFASSGRQIGAHNQSVVGQAGAAQDIEAQSSAHTAVAAAATLFTESGSYENATETELAAFEPSLQYTTGPSTGADVVSVAGSGQEFGAAVLSSSGTCFWIHATPAGVLFGTGAPCTGQSAMRASLPSW